MITIEIKCWKCDRIIKIEVEEEDLDKFNTGQGYIQDIFPYLTKDQREMFISQTCGQCFNDLFKSK